tara:strand:- start:397 stop:726 length:330 start_codon:yes stop_codon:yes gene_type:complete
MRKEKVVVTRISDYGKVLGNKFKDALGNCKEKEIDICRAEIRTYNKMVHLLQGNGLSRYDMRPESYFVSVTVEDLKPIDAVLLVDAVAKSKEDHKRTMAFFDAMNEGVK